ncbi:MAG: nicotinate (nicotinamide) nucleotide adenylyltransferase [Sumerlaeia bacterium]
MRIGIFGGTFDPPHNSHLMACLWALNTGEVDRVLMIPTARHAFGKEPAAPFAHRLAMCAAAAQVFAPGRIEISDIEGRREGTSYMVDTVEQLLGERPGEQFRLIVGSDIIDSLPKWRAADRLTDMAPVLEVPRISATDPNQSKYKEFLGAVPMLSSTEVRQRLAQGGDVRGLIPAPVVEYIRAHGLYSAA